MKEPAGLRDQLLAEIHDLETHITRRRTILDNLDALYGGPGESSPAKTNGRALAPPASGSLEDRIVAFIAKAGDEGEKFGEIVATLKISHWEAKRTIRELVDAGRLKTSGVRSGTRYHVKGGR